MKDQNLVARLAYIYKIMGILVTQQCTMYGGEERLDLELFLVTGKGPRYSHTFKDKFTY